MARRLRKCEHCNGGPDGIPAACRKCNGAGYERLQPAYLKWIRLLPCISCGTLARSEAHHEWLTHADRGIGIRAPDNQAVPLCRNCHQVRTDSNRALFWKDLEELLGNIIVMLNVNFEQGCWDEAIERYDYDGDLAMATDDRWTFGTCTAMD